MVKFAFLSWFFVPTIALMLPLLTLLSLAQSPKPVRRSVPPPIKFTPPPPPDPGEPDNRGQGGGSRGPCRRYAGLTALVPSGAWGVTVSEHPTMWIYAPAGLAARVPLEFVLRDRQGNALYKTSFVATELPAGVMQLTLPTQVKLQVQQSYQWSLAIYCDATEPDTPKVVRGSIERRVMSPQIQQELTAAKTALKRAQIYAKQGVWYDAITTLGLEIAANQSADAKAAWSELLKAQNLNASASAAIVPCCTLK